MNNVKVIIAGINADGKSDILVCYLDCSDADIGNGNGNGIHIVKAERMTLKRGYLPPLVSFDKTTESRIANVICHLESPIPFSFDDNAEDKNKIVSGKIVINQQGLTIQVTGFSDHISEDDEGCLAMMEFYNNELVLNTWSDINEEDATNRISFDNAANSKREQSA